MKHGDEDARQWFVQKFEEQPQTFNILNPNVGQRYEL